jgi:hypothetical protein
MPQLTAAETTGNIVGQGAGIVGNFAGGVLNRMGGPMSGAAGAFTNQPWPYTP